MDETPPVGGPAPPGADDGAEGAPEGPPARQTTPFLVLQFFVFPLAIVAVAVAVFVVFGLIAGEGKGPREYLAEIRAGGINRRWQAAYELSKILQARKDPALQDPSFVGEMIALFEEAAADDPRVRRYLARALGLLADRRAVPALVKVIQPGATNDGETRINSALALGTIGDPTAVPDLVRLAGDEDRGVRKAAVFALGAFGAEEALAALVKALEDPADDVRWNAAVALGRRGDVRAGPALLQMMSREHLARVQVDAGSGANEGLSAEQTDAAVLEAVRAAAGLDDPEIRRALERLRDDDPNLEVREAARRALAGLQR
jgi:HEAT repeat protein